MNEFFYKDVECDEYNARQIEKMDESSFGSRKKMMFARKLKGVWDAEQIKFVRWLKRKQASQVLKEVFKV